MSLNNFIMQKGFIGCLPAIIIAVALSILMGIGINEGIGRYYEECVFETDDVLGCMLSVANEPEPEGAATATGIYSFKGYSVNMTLNIPLEGGAVTGSVSGTCDGKIKGTFDGKNNGAISGKMSGTCDPFFVNIPASATFGGIVNKDGKVVPISFDGKATGYSHSGSMSLSY